MGRRVVITGMGALTPIGNSVAEYEEGLRSGKCGIDFITHFDTSDMKVKIAGELKDYDVTSVIDKKETKRMDPFIQYAVCAADEAVKSSGIDLDKIDRKRLGVVVGSGIGGLGTIQDQVLKMQEKGPSKVAPLFIPMAIINLAAGQIAIKYGARGMCESVVTACATGSDSIGSAYRQVKDGYLDYCITGGAEAGITRIGIAGFAALKALSQSEDPKRASIPFDMERGGFVMGEGAGILFIESLDSALARGAQIYAEIVGYGATCDAFHITSPLEDGSGAADAMKMAMEEAGVSPSDIDYINAHGTSTHANDSGETKAIKLALGEAAQSVSISSTKSMTGHLLGATGAIEAIACVLAMRGSFVPPTIGYKVPDPECDLNYTPNKAVEKEINYALSNTLGFGGHNAVLCLKKYVQ